MSDDEDDANGDTVILLDKSPTDESEKLTAAEGGEASLNATVAQRPSNKSCIVTTASIIAAIGGLLFGYDVGIISGALLQLEKEWRLDCSQKQWVVSSMLFGALAGSCIGGFIVDKIGRKRTIILNSVGFISGAAILACSVNFAILILGRVLVGFAVSLSAISECIYISEIAPPAKRGLLVSLNELGITVGFLVAYLMNYFLAGLANGWRYMFGASVLPALVQTIGMFFLPSSPHYLMLRKREQDAEKVLSMLRGQTDVRQELTNIRISLDAERDQSCFALFGKQNMKYRMLIAMGLVTFQQFTGQPNVLYYASVIFQSVGFCSENDATFASVVLGIIKLGATVVSMFLVDRAGRRIFLLLGAVLMAASICGLGMVALAHPSQFQVDSCMEPFVSGMTLNDSIVRNTLAYANLNSTILAPGEQGSTQKLLEKYFPANSSSTTLVGHYVSANEACTIASQHPSDGTKWFSLAFLMIYVASYSIGFGPVTWLVLSEIFPTAIKGRAVAAASIINWVANILISSTFLDVMGFLTVGGTFLTYGLLCLLSIIFVFLIVPETKGKSLQQIANEIKQSHPSKRIAENLRRVHCCHHGRTRRYQQVAGELNANGDLAETTT